MDSQHYKRISELLLYCYDGSAGSEEIEELRVLLDQSPEALEYCVDIAMDLNYFHCLAQIPMSDSGSVRSPDKEFMSELDPQQQMALLGDFAEYEKNADTVEIRQVQPISKSLPIKSIKIERPARKLSKFSVAAAVFSAAAIFLMIVYVHLAPPAPYEVATILDSMDAQWSSNLSTHPGTRIASNTKPIQLTRGIVKLRTDDQVDIVLEAPAEFHFQSYSEVSMNYGKLFAHVGEQGYGFSVVTPNSKIIDLGTEFGVLSHIDGNTEVHLYKGKANIFAGEKHQPKTSQLLNAGSAVKVDSRSSDIQDITLNEQALVRHFDSQSQFRWRGEKAIRLCDLLLDGNGFGTASRRSIEYEPETGQIVPSAVAWYRSGPGTFVPISGSPYLDGIFVPGSEDGRTVISTAGHQFEDCPKTTGLYYANIMCYKDWSFFPPLQQIFEQTGKQYQDSGALYMHSNVGLTVDLNAVRLAVPGLKINSFSAYAGIIRQGSNAPEPSEVDVWVLVDGQIRSVRKALRADQGHDIHISLADTDHFLTLVVTDGGKVYMEGFPANHFDTCGFVEPVFGLTSP